MCRNYIVTQKVKGSEIFWNSFYIISQLLASRVAKNTNCNSECPKPCNQSVYEPVLSYAQLSTQNVDGILVNDYAPLMEEYSIALEARQRLDANILTRDITAYQNLIDGYDELTRFVEVYTYGVQSNLYRAWESAKVILTKLTKTDIELQFNTVEPSFRSLDGVFKQSLNVQSKNQDDLEYQLKQIVVVATAPMPGNEGIAATKSLVDTARVRASVQQALTIQLGSTMADSRNISFTYSIPDAYLPTRLYGNPIECAYSITNYEETLAELLVELNKLR